MAGKVASVGQYRPAAGGVRMGAGHSSSRAAIDQARG